MGQIFVWIIFCFIALIKRHNFSSPNSLRTKILNFPRGQIKKYYFICLRDQEYSKGPTYEHHNQQSPRVTKRQTLVKIKKSNQIDGSKILIIHPRSRATCSHPPLKPSHFSCVYNDPIFSVPSSSFSFSFILTSHFLFFAKSKILSHPRINTVSKML